MGLSYDLTKQKLKKTFSLTRISIVIFIILISIAVILIIIKLYDNECKQLSEFTTQKIQHYSKKNLYFERRKNRTLSELGKVLFLNAPYPKPRFKNFTILVWKEGTFLHRRHVNFFSNQTHDPFELCSVNNCKIVYEIEDLKLVDAIIFSLQKFQGLSYLPDGPRLSSQRWIFLTDESPFNTFRNRKDNDWRNYSNIFNWSMSYKMESDVPVPYGRVLPVTKSINEPITKLIPYWDMKQRKVLVAIKTAECGSDKRRIRYLEELSKRIDVDVFGKCAVDSSDLCSRMSDVSCQKLNRYLFYLSFEDSSCNEFVTENTYWLGYSRGAVPIVMGPPRNTCETLLPPGSYLHTDDFDDPSMLAERLMRLNGSNAELLGLHEWRRRFIVHNEHGYYGSKSYHYCRVCEALNYNDESAKEYSEEDLSAVLSVERNCN